MPERVTPASIVGVLTLEGPFTGLRYDNTLTVAYHLPVDKSGVIKSLETPRSCLIRNPKFTRQQRTRHHCMVLQRSCNG
jgi:hypothetical protein